MAKKVKKKIEEDEDYKTFTFPEFDVAGFIHHELEQTTATFLSVFMAVAMALLSWRLTLYGEGLKMGSTFSLVAFILGVAGAVAYPFLVHRLREKAPEYRTGDWGTLIALYIFMWLGLWSLFLNV